MNSTDKIRSTDTQKKRCLQSLPFYLSDWYDDNEIIKEGIISRFEKESDGMSYLVWQEKFVECGEIDNGSAWY